MNTNNTNNKSIANNIFEPTYYHRDFDKDFKCRNRKHNSKSLADHCLRITNVALPFISLYKPLGQGLTLAMGITRSVTNLVTLKTAFDKKDKGEICWAMLQTAISVTSVASTIFAHPVGMLISTGQDLVLNASQLVSALKNNDFKKAGECCAQILNSALYLGLFFSGASEIVIASLSLQILLGMYQSSKEFREGNYLEGMGHAIMACIRGHQAFTEVCVLKLQKAIDAHMAEVAKAEEEISRSTIEGSTVNSARDPIVDEELEFSTQKEITDKAREYFQKDDVKNRKAPELDLSQKLSSDADDGQVIDALLKDYRGFCLGENHYQISARRFLINNMNYLKSKNVKVLFSEGWCPADTKIIDKYFSVKHLRELSFWERIQVELMLDQAKYDFKGVPGSPYTVFAVMETAKRQGIRMVGIDYDHSLERDYHTTFDWNRLTKMNFIAGKVMDATMKKYGPNDKFVAFMGAAHLRQDQLDPAPGVADLAEVPAIWIKDQEVGDNLGFSYTTVPLGAQPVNILCRSVEGEITYNESTDN